MTVHSELPQYPRGTAGFQMTRRLPIAYEDETLRVLHDRLVQHSADYKTVHYVYVLDRSEKLTGMLSISSLFTEFMERTVKDVSVRTPLYTVHPRAHQEHVASLALRHHMKSVPVTDADHHFLGAITSDTILGILHAEMHEDSLKRAGIRHPDAVHESVLSLSLFSSVRHRIPWLVLGLVGGIFGASLIGFFEETLARHLVLASFIPLIVYMSGAVGTQMETYIIRDLALDSHMAIGRYIWKQFLVVFFVGFSLAGLLGLSYGIVDGHWHMALVLSLSLFFAVLSSVCTGLIIPFIFSKCSLDPADASGPVATIIQDLLSIVIYFSIATVLL